MPSKIYGKYSKLGTGREYLVAQMFSNWGWIVQESTFLDDVSNQIDLIVSKHSKTIYVQIKGFFDGWRDYVPSKLLDKATEDHVRACICFVSNKGKIYTKWLKK